MAVTPELPLSDKLLKERDGEISGFVIKPTINYIINYLIIFLKFYQKFLYELNENQMVN